MPKKLVFILCLAIGLIGIIILLNKQKGPLSTPLQINKQTTPSETLISYEDQAGFIFSYPDNLSISNKLVENTISNDISDPSTYADIQLSSKQVNGSLSLKISDSKFTTLDEWLKLNEKAATGKAKEVKLGDLEALEIQTTDRLLLGSLDKGVLFTVEMPLIEQDFWKKAYNKVLTSFSFVRTTEAVSQTDSSYDDVAFEGEEVIE